jgi:hypothetical protein
MPKKNSDKFLKPIKYSLIHKNAKIMIRNGFDGPKSSGFSNFNFSDADSLFERFFKNSGFDSNDD